MLILYLGDSNIFKHCVLILMNHIVINNQDIKTKQPGMVIKQIKEYYIYSSNKTSQKTKTHLHKLTSCPCNSTCLISSSWYTETIDFHLLPIGTNSQNVIRVSQTESAIYKGDVIMVRAYCFVMVLIMRLIVKINLLLSQPHHGHFKSFGL